MTHLEALRAIVRLANERSPHIFRLQDCDPDLAREAGMDGNLARLLQTARDLDTERAEAEKSLAQELDALLADY